MNGLDAAAEVKGAPTRAHPIVVILSDYLSGITILASLFCRSLSLPHLPLEFKYTIYLA